MVEFDGFVGKSNAQHPVLNYTHAHTRILSSKKKCSLFFSLFPIWTFHALRSVTAKPTVHRVSLLNSWSAIFVSFSTSYSGRSNAFPFCISFQLTIVYMVREMTMTCVSAIVYVSECAAQLVLSLGLSRHLSLSPDRWHFVWLSVFERFIQTDSIDMRFWTPFQFDG